MFGPHAGVGFSGSQLDTPVPVVTVLGPVVATVDGPTVAVVGPMAAVVLTVVGPAFVVVAPVSVVALPVVPAPPNPVVAFVAPEGPAVWPPPPPAPPTFPSVEPLAQPTTEASRSA